MPCSSNSLLRGAATAVALLFTCGFLIGLSEGQLTLTALPNVLFVNNSGVHKIEFGTVVRARCTALNPGGLVPTVTWYRNNSALVNDPPHIRIRNKRNGTEISSVLTVDNFVFENDGEYYCQASNDTNSLSSSTLTLSAVNDSSVYLYRDPVVQETQGGGVLKTYDIIRDNRTAYTLGLDFEPSEYFSTCCRVLHCIASFSGDITTTNISQVTITWLRDEQEVENMPNRIELSNRNPRVEDGDTIYATTLRFLPLKASDIGIYQCVYSDYDNDAELVYSTPFRLDPDNNGTEVSIEAVSPSNIVLIPPEKLVIEVESSGGYYRHAWFKNNEELYPNGDDDFAQANPARFSEFFQVYVQDGTTTADHGLYRVELVNSLLSAYQSVEFAVTPPVSLSVEALNTTTITIVEGESINIACIAKANPLPSSITWSLRGNSTSFSQSDLSMNITAFLDTGNSFSFTEGNRTSTLHITDGMYPSHSGVYTCSSSLDSSSANASITVEIQVPPEVSVSPTRTVVPIGQSTTLTCTITRSQPTNYTVQWSLTNTTGVTTTLNETSETLQLTAITEQEFGNYTCSVSNSAGLSGSASITIQQGVAIIVSIEDVEAVVVGDQVSLNCTATGGTSQLVYQWTMGNSTTVLNADNTTGLLSLTNVGLADFGTYTCTVSDNFISEAASIDLEQAALPAVASGATTNVSVVEGNTLKLVANFVFNMALDSITWEREGRQLTNGVDRVTITDGGLEPPNATSTLTITTVDRDIDDGTYSATASNRVGSVNATFNVDIFYPPEVSVSATQTRLPVNDSTNLTCVVDNSNPPEFTISWSFTGTTGVTVSLNYTNPTLELVRIGTNQFGTYTCNVTNSEGLSGDANVTIVKGDIPEVSAAPVDPAIPGDNVTLNCMASGDTPLVYQWTMQGNTTILNTDNTTGVLMLLNINENQFGTYVCRVTNNLGSDTAEVTLEPIVAPTASNGRNVTFDVGEDLELMVRFTDYNLELDGIVWTQNSTVPLRNRTNGTIVTNTELIPPSANSTLIRSSITGISFAGTYTATASNRAGINSTIFTVDIISEPEILTEPAEFEFNETSSVQLECRARGIPPVEISWSFEEGNSTTITTNIELVDDMYETVSILRIPSIRRTDSGSYFCTARNRVTSDSIFINITINYAPIVAQSPMNQEVLAPNAVTLSCSFEGEPSPDVIWVSEDPNGTITEYQESVSGSFTVTMSKSYSFTTSMLRVDATSTFDSADYSCRGENLLGSNTSQPAVLTVYVSPSIEAKQLNFAIEFQSLEVTCSATGVPPPNITFLMGDTILDGSGSGINSRVRLQNHTNPVLNEDRLYEVNRTLEIVEPLRNESGRYTCLATTNILNQILTNTSDFEIFVEVPPTIQVGPEDVTVLSPETAVFNCSAFGIPLPFIQWEMDGEMLLPGGDIRVEFTPNVTLNQIFNTLYIDNTLPNNTGNYSCVAINGPRFDRVSAYLTVNYAPEITDPQPLTTFVVNEGMTTVFECTAVGIPAPNITWRRNDSSSDLVDDPRVSLGTPTDTQPVTTSDGVMVSSVTRRLNISDTMGSDARIYYCVASNGAEEELTVEVEFQLFVRVAPEIQVAPRTRTVQRGEAGVFTCNATGIPPPLITWWILADSGNLTLINTTNTEGRITITNSVPFDNRTDPFGGVIEITNTLNISLSSPSDAGVYVCRAENEAGLVEANATLAVLVAPEIIFPPENFLYETIQFSVTEFICIAAGIPPPNIEFYKNQVALVSDDRINVTHRVIDYDRPDLIPRVTTRLLIYETLDLDSDNYSCTARGINASDSVPFQLVVFVVPEIVDGPESQIVVENEMVVLTCLATGRPPPVISWFSGSTEAQEGGGVSIETVQSGARNVTSNLIIDFVHPRDTGMYTCRANNTAGNVTKSANLTVHVPAMIDALFPYPRLIVNESDTAEFRCNATGIPAPLITWSTGNQPLDGIVSSGDQMTLDPSDLMLRINITDTESYDYQTDGGPVLGVTSVLSVYSTLGSDTGNYTCMATNEIGVSMTQVQSNLTSELYVQVPPVVIALTPEVIGIETESATLRFRIDNAEPGVLLSGLRWLYSGDLSGSLDDITNLTNRTMDSWITTSFNSDGVFFNITIRNIVQRRRDGEETDEGRYFLRATNPAGTHVAYADLDVYGPPLIIVPPEDQFAISGASATFSCGALAIPAHYTEWTYINTYGEETLIISTNGTNSSKYGIVNSNSSLSFGQLVVNSVEYADRGIYMCTTINVVGRQSELAYLTVHVPPDIVSTSPATEVVFGNQSLLMCRVSGYPHPNVTWLKNDNLTMVEETNRIRLLRFEGPASEGSGSGFEERSGDGPGEAPGEALVETPGEALEDRSGSGSGSGRDSISEDIRELIYNSTRDLEELEVESVLVFVKIERGDTGNYTCRARNSLPGGETGTLVNTSQPISFTVLEVPDPVTGFSSIQNGTRWVAFIWTFGFDGNSRVTSINILIKSDENVEEINVASVDTNSYNLTEGIVPFTEYDFQLAACNSIGCGSYNESITIMTAEDAPEAAPMITESFSPSSTSLVLSWTPPPADKRNGNLTDYFIYYTDDPDLSMDAWEEKSTVDNGITLSDLKIFTQYTVSVAASTAAGVGPFNTSTIMTLNDTCSRPLAVTATDIGETNISLSWIESQVPNGLISGYLITYEEEGEGSSLKQVMSTAEMIQLVDLDPYTTYTITVTCINGAGRGNTSSPLSRMTNSAPPPSLSNAIVTNDDQANGRQFVVVFNKPNETNGPISHYHAVAVKVPDSAQLNQPDSDFNSFDSIDNVYSPECGELREPSAYIAAEFGNERFQGSSLTFTFGDEEDELNDRSRYSNGLLCYSTRYAFFLRVYNDQGGNVKRSVKQTSSDRQYERFSSSGYLDYNTESEPSAAGSSTGTIAGVVVVIIILIIAAVVIVTVLAVLIKKKRITVYKTQATESAAFDISFYSNENVQLTEIRNPEDAEQRPIPVGQFAVYVEQLHLHENCGFGEQYKVLQDKCPKHDVEACINQDNRQRNRYANIQCFDHSRCILKPIEGHEHDYINANFIHGYNRHNEYIATQGPLPNTVGDFWRLIWDHNVYTIVMLTNLTEKMKVKCSQYWPSEDTQTYADIKVTVKASTSHADFVVRTFEAKRGEGEEEEVRQVHQFHYVSWPDFGVPRHATPVLHFLRRVRDTHIYSNPRPILIHCSAGVGRTGSLIVIDVELQRAQKEGVVDPYNYVFKMRDQRNHMVQTEAQYIFLHDAILEGTTSGRTEIPVEGLFSRMKELELLDKDGESGYRTEFARLRQFRVNIKEFTDANDNANQLKNRLANALPYNDNRVYLVTLPGVSGSDYINASYIDGYSRKGTFIATQGPLPETVNDFWRMVAEREIHVIVMLTQLEEKGKEMCARYWPEKTSVPETRGSVSIELLSEESFQDYTHRKIKLDESAKGAQVSRVVNHFQFTAWPENGAPEEGAGMIDLIGQVLRVQQQTGNKPIIVHCNAGIGRTGAFCALSTAIERVKAEGLIDIFHTVKHLRTQRPHMVQTLEQYIFCYQAIKEYVTSLEEYSNFT